MQEHISLTSAEEAVSAAQREVADLQQIVEQAEQRTMECEREVEESLRSLNEVQEEMQSMLVNHQRQTESFEVGLSCISFHTSILAKCYIFK